MDEALPVNLTPYYQEESDTSLARQLFDDVGQEDAERLRKRSQGSLKEEDINRKMAMMAFWNVVVMVILLAILSSSLAAALSGSSGSPDTTPSGNETFGVALPEKEDKDYSDWSFDNSEAKKDACCCHCCYAMCPYSSGCKLQGEIPQVKPRKGRITERRYSFVCVFEYLRNNTWPEDIQCTDYVFVRMTSLATYMTNGPTPVSGKMTAFLRSGSEKYRAEVLEKDLRRNFRLVHSRYSHATWYIGMWGAMFTRLMNTQPLGSLKQGIHNYLHYGMAKDGWNKSDFDGFALVHTILRNQDLLPHHLRLQDFFNSREFTIVPPGWLFLHTIAPAYTPPYVQEGDAMAKFLLKGATTAGITTSNASLSNVIPANESPDFSPVTWISPPNPLSSWKGSNVGMVQFLDKFATWEKVFNKTNFCFSITTAINFIEQKNKSIDFTKLAESAASVRRYSRFELTRKVTMRRPLNSSTPRYPLDYEYDNQTESHCFFTRTPGRPNEIWSALYFDDQRSLANKLEKLFHHYTTGNCVVLDDVGDDSDSLSFSLGTHDFVMDAHMMQRAISEQMRQRWGAPFRRRH